jgi:hypothetical protein
MGNGNEWTPKKVSRMLRLLANLSLKKEALPKKSPEESECQRQDIEGAYDPTERIFH